MWSGHEAGAKTCRPAAHWAGWERPVGGAEQSMPPPTLRPESYRFLLCVKSRCWWTSNSNEGKGKKRHHAKECERRSRKQKVVLEVATCPPPFPRLCLELQAVTCKRIQTQPLHLSAPLGSLLLQGLKCRRTRRRGWRFCQWRRSAAIHCQATRGLWLCLFGVFFSSDGEKWKPSWSARSRKWSSLILNNNVVAPRVEAQTLTSTGKCALAIFKCQWNDLTNVLSACLFSRCPDKWTRNHVLRPRSLDVSIFFGWLKPGFRGLEQQQMDGCVLVNRLIGRKLCWGISWRRHLVLM